MKLKKPTKPDKDALKPQAITPTSLLLMSELCLDVATDFDYFGGMDPRSQVKKSLAMQMAVLFEQWAQENEQAKK